MAPLRYLLMTPSVAPISAFPCDELLLGGQSFQALIEVRGAVARQDLVHISFLCALPLPDLLGAPLLGGLPEFWSDLAGVHKCLRAGRRRRQQRNHHESKDRFQMSLRKRPILNPTGGALKQPWDDSRSVAWPACRHGWKPL